MSDDLVRDLVSALVRARATRVEEMIQRMLLDSAERGIAIIESGLTFNVDAMEYAISQTYSLDSHVSWGSVYTFPSQDAYDAWVDRGYPRGV